MRATETYCYYLLLLLLVSSTKANKIFELYMQAAQQQRTNETSAIEPNSAAAAVWSGENCANFAFEFVYE